MTTLRDYRHQIDALRARMRELQQMVEPQAVENYRLLAPEGALTLAELFGDKEYLFVVHNMGAGCVYCTLWADGFNGVVPHLEDRAAFVVSTPDDPEAQNRFKASRGWKFRMVSHQGTTFAADLGYANGDGMQPGVSVFKKFGDRITRVSDADFGPGDDFSTPWHLFDLIPEGAAGWEPRYRY
jgi:predicted dithiol-disulfide oxidoreductase (DUF899 family)